MIKITNRIILFLAVIGLLISIYLSYSEIVGIPPKCTLLTGCEIVQESVYSHIFGVPVAFFGVLFYIFLISMTFIRLRFEFKKILAKVLLFITFLGFLFSIYLTYIELYIIFAICVYCVLSAIVSTLLFFTSLYENIKRL